MLFGQQRLIQVLALPVIDALRVGIGRWPHIPGDQLEQLRLARTIATRQHPALAGLYLPADLLQHRPALISKADLLQLHTHQRTHG